MMMANDYEQHILYAEYCKMMQDLRSESPRTRANSTGKKYPKAKHRFTPRRSTFLVIAGLWRDGKGNQPPSFALLTTEPGPDVAPIHDRQVAVLKPGPLASLARRVQPEDELLRPLP
ncbi:putative SOS response-associated peptidase YedK [Mycoplana sp. BE70]|uniref:SOS response-associated peptidase family protein n=1 Tax=Mycoplana sp. BE70 TaxID=2817775 RepID=UPI00285643D3|nr:putative SOS response-associated peptidase YedK [Mycoplana sp. BE70]